MTGQERPGAGPVPVDVLVLVAGAGPDGGPGPGEDHEDDLRSLLRWVRADEGVEGVAAAGGLDGGRIVGAPPGPGEMGLGFDVLQFAVGSGISLGALAVSVAQWLDARAERSRRRVVVLRRGGTEIELPAGADADPAALARLLAPLLALAPPAPPAPAPAVAPPPPAPVRAPEPVPAPVPAPAAGGEPEPAPVPRPVREPGPVRAPEPVPSAEPAPPPVPPPAPVPEPLSEPAPTPASGEDGGGRAAS